MHKVLIHFKISNSLADLLGVASITIYTYAFCVVLGAIIACLYINTSAKRSSLGLSLPHSFYYSLFIAGFLGGKIFYFLENPSLYIHNPRLLLTISTGGFVCYGSIIFVTLYAIFYAKKNHLSTFGLLDILSIASVLPIAFGRIGCFFNGCCYGTVTKGFTGFVFPATSPIAVHPTQLYEAALMLLILACLLCMNRVKKWQGQVFLLNMTLYAIGRALIETIRGDTRGFLFHHAISHAQALAMIATLISILLFIKLNKQHNHTIIQT